MSGKTYKTRTEVSHTKRNSVNVAENDPVPRRQVPVRRLYREGRTLGMDCPMCGRSLTTDQEIRVQRRMLELEDQIRQHRTRNPGEVIELSLSVEDILGSAQNSDTVVTCPYCDQELSEDQARTCAHSLHRFEGKINRTILKDPTGPSCITLSVE